MGNRTLYLMILGSLAQASPVTNEISDPNSSNVRRRFSTKRCSKPRTNNVKLINGKLFIMMIKFLFESRTNFQPSKKIAENSAHFFLLYLFERSKQIKFCDSIGHQNLKQTFRRTARPSSSELNL